MPLHYIGGTALQLPTSPTTVPFIPKGNTETAGSHVYQITDGPVAIKLRINDGKANAGAVGGYTKNRRYLTMSIPSVDADSNVVSTEMKIEFNFPYGMAEADIQANLLTLQATAQQANLLTRFYQDGSVTFSDLA
jgi:hypothetical protein